MLFALFAGHGEFPRAVLAPGSIEQCVYEIARAFNIAEKYQMPVMVLTDSFLANSLRSVDMEAIDFRKITENIERGKLILPHEHWDIDEAIKDGYRRYEFTEDGISLRIPPGHPKAVYSIAGEEHIPEGFIDWEERADNRIKMMQKRVRKLDVAVSEMKLPQLYGPEDAELTFVCWGSSLGASLEAMERLNNNGTRTNLLQFIDIHPLDWERVAEILTNCKRWVSVEGNYSTQLSRWIRMNTGLKPAGTVTRYDGRPLNPFYIVEQLQRLLVKI